jgi:hypothetical protein
MWRRGYRGPQKHIANTMLPPSTMPQPVGGSLVAECVDRVEAGGLASGVIPERQPHRHSDADRGNDRRVRYFRRPVE